MVREDWRFTLVLQESQGISRKPWALSMVLKEGRESLEEAEGEC